MAAYLVKLDRSLSGHQLVGDVDAMVLFAPNDDSARQMAAAKYPGDGLAWINDSSLTILDPPENWDGWTLRVFIQGGLGAEGDESAEFTVTAALGSESSMSAIAALMVDLINAHPDIAGAAYDTETKILTVAGEGDNLGDQMIEVSVTPLNGEQSVPALMGEITHGGVAGDALTVTLPNDDESAPPKIHAVLKQVD